MSSKMGFTKSHCGCQQIKIPILHNGFSHNGSQNKSALLYKIKMRIGVVEPHPRYYQ
jgi:hypothetical protein